MPKITKLEEQKKRRGRVNVYLDGKFEIGVTEKLVIDFDLYQGKELSEEEVEKLRAGESKSKCLDAAYRYLSYRPRSEKEMRDKLGEKYEQNDIEETIKKLKDYKFINDKEFARLWVAERRSGRGAKALAFELSRKGIEKSVIEEAVSAVDKASEIETAKKLVEGKSKYQGLDRNEAYKKVGGFLTRRGYSYDVIKEVINELSTN